MKKLLIAGIIISMNYSVFAEPNITPENIKIKMVGSAPDYSAVQSEAYISTEDFEKLVIEIQKNLNDLSPVVANLATKSHSTIMKADSDNLKRLTDTAGNIMENLLAVVEKYEAKDPNIKVLRKKLNKVYLYNFGPKRVKKIKIAQISNEGKGSITYNNRTIRYVVAPGLKATIQNEKEVIAIERLPNGQYKIANGIFYSGQENVILNWDPRTYKRVDWFLDYHNVTKDLLQWLKCGNSKCVKYSENKTVN